MLFSHLLLTKHSFILVTDENIDHQFIRLKFYGIDTIASIYFNNEIIAKSTNMFTSFRVVLPSHSFQAINSLEVDFSSPTIYAKNQSEWYKNNYHYDVPPTSAPPAQHGRDNPNFIRKEQCSFSWVRILSVYFEYLKKC